MMTPSFVFLATLVTTSVAFAPTILSSTRTTTTSIALDKTIAEMIDQELYRQGHQEEYRTEWMKKNRQAVVAKPLETTTVAVVDDVEDIRQRRKDTVLAQKNPQQYCADRCIATGNCEVYEDFFDLSAMQVVEFCNDCVLADDEEPCEIPEAFFDSGKFSP